MLNPHFVITASALSGGWHEYWFILNGESVLYCEIIGHPVPNPYILSWQAKRQEGPGLDLQVERQVLVCKCLWVFIQIHQRFIGDWTVNLSTLFLSSRIDPILSLTWQWINIIRLIVMVIINSLVTWIFSFNTGDYNTESGSTENGWMDTLCPKVLSSFSTGMFELLFKNYFSIIKHLNHYCCSWEKNITRGYWR